MSPRRRRRVTLAGAGLVALAAALVPACLTAGSPSAEADPVVSVSSAGGLVAAYASAEPGTTIQLVSGTYAPKQLKRAVSAPPLTTPVTVRPAAGADVIIENLDVNGPALHLQDLHLTGIIRFRARAVDSRLERASVDAGNVIVEGDRVTVTESTIRPPADRDALDIGATDGTGPDGVVVRGNVLGPGRLTTGSTAHVDCLQVMSGTNLVVADNLLYDCPAQTLLVKSDLGPIDDVDVVRNALRGCLPRTDACPAYMTLQVVPGQHAIRDISLRGNSVAGALRAVAGIDGVVMTGNAIDRVEDGCGYPMTDNVVGSARCQLPPGNHTALPTWTDVEHEPPNLRPAAGSPTIDHGAAVMDADADGRLAACGPRWDAGAYERCD